MFSIANSAIPERLTGCFDKKPRPSCEERGYKWFTLQHTLGYCKGQACKDYSGTWFNEETSKSKSIVPVSLTSKSESSSWFTAPFNRDGLSP